MGGKNSNRPTEVLTGVVVGNKLFESAIKAVGLDPNMIRHVVAGVLTPIGAKPQTLSPDELGVILPSLEEKLRLLVPPDKAHACIAKLRHLLISWEG